MGRQPQQFTAEEAAKRLMLAVNRVMFYANAGQNIPGHAIEFMRDTKIKVDQKYKAPT